MMEIETTLYSADYHHFRLRYRCTFLVADQQSCNYEFDSILSRPGLMVADWIALYVHTWMEHMQLYHPNTRRVTA